MKHAEMSSIGMKSIRLVAIFLTVGALLSVSVCCTQRAHAQGSAETAPAMATVTLHIEGMSCPSCSVAVRIALKKLDGVRDARVSVQAKRAVVDYVPAKVSPQQLVDAVNRLGYEASIAPKFS